MNLLQRIGTYALMGALALSGCTTLREGGSDSYPINVLPPETPESVRSEYGNANDWIKYCSNEEIDYCRVPTAIYHYEGNCEDGALIESFFDDFIYRNRFIKDCDTGIILDVYRGYGPIRQKEDGSPIIFNPGEIRKGKGGVPVLIHQGEEE